MTIWDKAPVVIGTFGMIASHVFSQSMGDMFGLSATFSVLGLLVLKGLVGPEEVREAVLEERRRCEAEFEKRTDKRRRYERGEITFGELCDPSSP